ncbi:MAG: hypothetical protein ACI9LM_002232 [Alteromonadaceae bacterium]|jgi:hypothetical protein
MTQNKLTYGFLGFTSLFFSLIANAFPQGDIEQDLVVLNPPEHKVERKTLHFSQPLTVDHKLSMKPEGFTSISDEYWFEISGRKLNEGVDIGVTKPGSLIRLSSKRSKGDVLPDDVAIDPKNIELFRQHQKISNPFSQAVSQQQLATANIFPNSSAIQLAENIGTGTFTLRVNNKLEDSQRYIVNVKEKGSDYKLHLSTASQSYSAGQLVSFKAQMHNKDHKLSSRIQQKAFIQFPSGQREAVKLTNKNGQYQVNVPENFTEHRLGELYELHLESKVLDRGIKIQRNSKFAFAVVQPTARLTPALSVADSGALVNIEVASEGRYEVSAFVYGNDKAGRLMPIMYSRSAYYLEAGEQQVELRFDENILHKSGAKPPYHIEKLKLMDQSRMTVLQQL